METDTEDEEEEERCTWIDDNDDAWALIRPPGRRPFWRNLLRGLLPVAPAVGATAGPGRGINTGRRGGAMLGSTVDTYSASDSGGFMHEFPLFLREWVLWILRSILVASPASIVMRKWLRSSSMMAVACVSLVLLVQMHLALCSRRLPAGRHAHAEKCADASGEHIYW